MASDYTPSLSLIQGLGPLGQHRVDLDRGAGLEELPHELAKPLIPGVRVQVFLGPCAEDDLCLGLDLAVRLLGAVFDCAPFARDRGELLLVLGA